MIRLASWNVKKNRFIISIFPNKVLDININFSHRLAGERRQQRSTAHHPPVARGLGGLRGGPGDAAQHAEADSSVHVIFDKQVSGAMRMAVGAKLTRSELGVLGIHRVVAHWRPQPGVRMIELERRWLLRTCVYAG